MDEYVGKKDVNAVLRECARVYPSSFYQGIEVARTAVIKLPAADVVEVVRCKDCRFYTPYVKSDPAEGKCKGYKLVCFDDFCSDGEREEGNG